MVEADATPPQIIALEVAPGALHHTFDSTSPEFTRLRDGLADGIAHLYPTLPTHVETLAGLVDGLPGLAEIDRLESSQAMGAERLVASLGSEVAKALEAMGIKVEETLQSGFTPLDPNTQLVLRRFLDRASQARYSQDPGRETYSYQQSVLKYFATRFK